MGSGQKIGILINCLEIGGAQKMALQVFDLLDRHGYETVMITMDRTRDMPLHPEKKRAEDLERHLVCLGGPDSRGTTPEKIMHAPGQYLRMLSCIRSHGLDTLISFEDRANIFNMISFFAKTRIISVRHPMKSVLAVKARVKAVLIHLFFSLFKHRISMATFNSHGSLEEFAELFGPGPDTGVIYNFCDHAQLTEDSRVTPETSVFAVSQTSRYIIACGRFKPVKGFLNLIRLFTRVAEQKKDCRLVILGDGPLRADYAYFIRKLGLENHVLLPGFQANTAPWIAGADAFVLTSQSEGFPNVLLEAMALGTPVVSADCRFGPREILYPGLEKGERVETPPAAVLAPYGILTPPMTDICPEPDAPLDHAESTMADTLVMLLLDHDMIKHYKIKGYARSLDFGKTAQEHKWLSLVQERGTPGRRKHG